MTPLTDEPLTSGSPLQLVEQLADMAGRRSEEEHAIDAAHAQRVAQAEQELAQRRAEIMRKYDARRAAAEQPQVAPAEVMQQFDAQRTSVGERLAKASRKVRRRYRQRLKAAKQKRDRVLAAEQKRYDDGVRAADARLAVEGEVAALRRLSLAELALAADTLLAGRGLAPPAEYESPDHATFDQDNHELFAVAVHRCEKALAAMRSLKSVRLASARSAVISFVAFAALGAGIAAVVFGFDAWLWMAGAGLLAGIAGSLVVRKAASASARTNTLKLWGEARGALAAAQSAATTAFADAQCYHQQQLIVLAEKRDGKVHKADAARVKEAATLRATLDRKLAANAAKVAERLERLDHERDDALVVASGDFRQGIGDVEAQRQVALAVLDDQRAERIAASQAQRDAEREEVAAEWLNTIRRMEADGATVYRPAARG